MQWKAFEEVAISAQPGVVTALGGQRSVLPSNVICKPVDRFIVIDSERVRKMGRTGDSPVPVGDLPTGGASPQLRRSDLFVADGFHQAKSPVGAASSGSMPLLRSASGRRESRSGAGRLALNR